MDYQILNTLFRCSKEFGHKKLRSCGLSETECLICSFVFQHEKCSQDDASSGLRIDKTTAAKAISTLEEKGFILRQTDKTDRRRKLLTLTEKGIDSCRGIINLHDSWLSEVMSALNKNEQEQFEEYCVKLLKKAEEMINRQNGEKL